MKRNPKLNRTDRRRFCSIVVTTATLFLAVFGTIEVADAQDRNGTPADGGQRFQYSVMVDGDFAVVGAEWHDGFRGAAYVLRREGTAWAVEQRLSPGDLGRYDHFGGSTAIAGDYIVVGAAWHDTFRGAAYVFKRVGDEWVEQQKLTASDATPDGRFGQSVAIDGEGIVVAAGSGSAPPTYRFAISGERWVERGKLAGLIQDAIGVSRGELSATSAVVSSLRASGLIEAAGDPPAMPAAPPPAVDTVLATNGTLEDRVEIRWASVGLDPIVYKVLRDDTLLSIVASDDSLYIDTTGSLNTTYQYCVVVKDMADQESTPTCADGRRIIYAPTSVSASDGQLADRVAITWVDISKIEDGYYVYRNGAPIDTLGANSSWADDPNADPEVVYDYEVSAFVATGQQSIAVSDSGWRGVVLPPVDVSASDGQHLDRVRITWDNQVPDTLMLGSRIYRDSVLIGTPSAGETQYDDTDTTVVFGSTYTYCVATIDTGGVESVWVCDEGGIGLTAPGNVAASDSTFDDRITVTWDDLSLYEDGYEISRMLAPDTVVLDTTRANAVFYNDFSASAGTTYTYSVRAISNDGGVSTAVTDDGFRSVVLAPVNIQATDGTFEDRVDITWESQSTTAVLFKIYRDSTLIKSVSRQVRSYSDYGGTAGQIYDYTVTAATALEAEATGSPDEGSRKLGAPSALTASDEQYEDRIVISWTDNSQLEHGYVVSRTDTSEAVIDTSYTIGPNRTALTDYTAVPGIVYSYSVMAFDSLNGTLGYSLPAEDLGNRVLLAPTDVQAEDGEHEDQVEITWLDNSNAEDGYRIYRDSLLIGETADNFTSYVDDSPVLGHVSAYSVTAYDSVPPLRMGESEAASDSGYTTILAPVSFNASDVYEDRVELAWVDVSNVETGYEIVRYSGSSTLPESLTVTDANITFYTDLDASQGVTYQYCVKAVRESTLVGEATIASGEECDDGLRFLAPDLETLELTTKLQASPFVAYDGFGYSVAVSGNVVIVGADWGSSRPGAAHVFERDADGHWNQIQKLSASDANNYDLFGYSVAIDGDRAIVGAQFNDDNGNASGSAYIFERQADGSWNETAPILTASDATSYDYFGFSVGIDGDWAVIGAYRAGINNSGQAYIFERINGVWTEVDILEGAIPENEDRFGISVSISGDRVIVGSEREDDLGNDSGAAYIFERDTEDNWILAGKIWADDGIAEDQFGRSVAIHGDWAVVGAAFDDAHQGAAYLFARDANGDWIPAQKLTASDGDPGDSFGCNVSIRGGVAIIGAFGDNNGMGSAYVFSMDPNTGNWNQTAKLIAAEGGSNDQFGFSTSFSGDVAVIGMQAHAVSAGSACILEMPRSPATVSASDGTFDSRVRITWDDLSSNEHAFRVYRDGEPTANVEANVEVYEDFDAEPGRTYEYSVAAFRSDVSVELDRISDFGWRPPNGNITGRISAVGGGASEGISVGLDPQPTKALLFDGTGGCVRVGRLDGGFDFSSSFTVEMWVKYLGLGGTGSSDATLVAKAAPQGSGPKRYPFWLSNMRSSSEPGRLRFAMSDSVKTVSVNTISTGLNDNTWHHVACVHDAAQGEIGIYIDGDLQGITPYANLGDITNTDSLSLAAGVKQGSWFGGQLDEVRIWNVARNASEIQASMSRQLTGDEQGLVGYWPLDEGSKGVITDPFSSAHYGVSTGGVYWADNSAPLDIHAQTGPAGTYVLSNLRYGNETTFKVRPFEGNRQFEPPYTMITLSVGHPVENQVNFSDISSYTLSGVVRYDTTGCAVPDIQMLVDGQPAGGTDKNGKFAVSVDNGQHSIRPSFEGHSFSPDSLTFLVEDDIDGLFFADMTKRTLSGYVGGGCGRRIGDVTITIRSEDNCLTESITADSAYSISLPPQKYLVSAAVVESSIPEGLIKSDVVRFFQNLGERQADLDSSDVILDMTYRAPLEVAIKGFDAYVEECPGPLTFDGRTLPDSLPVIPQLTVLDLVIEVKENYGSGGKCALDSGTVVIYDEIFDQEGTPIELEVRDGEAGYTTFASTPNLLVGRTDAQGNDRSFQKAIRAVAVVEGRAPVTGEEWVLVTGHVAAEGADFITATSELPLYILRDPPGDRSSAFLEKGHSLRTNTYYSNFTISGQGGLRINVWRGVKQGWFLGLGAGAVYEADFKSTTETEFMFGGMTNKLSRTDLTVTTKRRISTSSDELFIGRKADVYVGAGVNYIFSEVGVVGVEDCQVVRSTDVGFQPDSITTIYAYTGQYIEDVLIPEFEAKVDHYESLDPDSAGLFQAKRDYWQYILAANDSLKQDAAVTENRSFSGGADYSFMCDSITTQAYTLLRTWTSDFRTDFLQFGFNSPYGGFTARFPVTAHTENATDFTDTTGVSTKSVGYVLSDDNLGDHFTVDIKQDGRYPSPVFDPLAGVASCPYEAWPDPESGEPRLVPRDKPKLYIAPDPPGGNVDVPPDEVAVFKLELGNDSPTGEARKYVLREVATANPHSAVIRANGGFVKAGLLLLVEPGQVQEITVTVARGPTRYSYEDLALMVYPLCEWSLWERGGPLNLADSVSFDVTFDAPCSEITLDPPQPGWAYDKAAWDTSGTLEMRLTDYEQQIGDKILQSVGVQYRRLGSGPDGPTEWTDIPAGPIGETETIIQWLPPADLTDGVYELQAYTECPGGRGYSEVSVGTIDRHAPVVFGTPEPADEDLSFGEDISVTFNEAIDCASIDPDSVTLTWLDGPSAGSRVPIETTCDGNAIVLEPTASASDLEGWRLEARVSAIRDVVGNAMEDSVTWAFDYRKSRFAWSEVYLTHDAAYRNPGTITAELVNGTGQPVDFTIITPLPDCLVGATPLVGTILPNQTQSVSLTLDDSLTIGEHEGRVTAEAADASQGLATLDIHVTVSCQEPLWAVDPSAYEHTMTMVAKLKIGGESSDDVNDKVAAFAGDELRGAANIIQVPVTDPETGFPPSYLAFLTVYSNRTQGETIRFQVWDADSCYLYNATLESYPFTANGQIGTPETPITLTATDVLGDSVLAINVSEGWTWFSTNIRSLDMSVAGVMSDLTPVSGDIVKSQTEFSQFVADTTGWVPALVLDNVSGYMMRLSQAGTILHSGAVVPVDTMIPVSQGWNWIGYLPVEPIEVTDALDDLRVQGIASDNDIVKSQDGFAQYVSGAWYGSLDSMRTGEGYKLYLAAAGDHSFNYPDSAPAASPPVASAAKVGRHGPVEGAPAWSVNPRAYQYNMTVTAVLRIDDTESNDPNDMIGAFVGGECRGLARPVYIDGIERYVAFLMIHSDAVEGEEVTFQAFDADVGLIYDIEESLACEADAIEGTVLEPIVFNAGPVRDDKEPGIPTAFGLAQNYPNPFNPSTVIRYDVPAGGGEVTLRVYDVGGRLVRTLVDGFETAGRKSATWHGRNDRGQMVATGVYFYRMTAPGFERTRKMVLLK